MISARGGATVLPPGVGVAAGVVAAGSAGRVVDGTGEISLEDLATGESEERGYAIAIAAEVDPSLFGRIVSVELRDSIAVRIRRPSLPILDVSISSRGVPVTLKGVAVLAGLPNSELDVSRSLSFTLPVGIDTFSQRVDVDIPPRDEEGETVSVPTTADYAWFRNVGVYLNPIGQRLVLQGIPGGPVTTDISSHVRTATAAAFRPVAPDRAFPSNGGNGLFGPVTVRLGDGVTITVSYINGGRFRFRPVVMERLPGSIRIGLVARKNGQNTNIELNRDVIDMMSNRDESGAVPVFIKHPNVTRAILADPNYSIFLTLEELPRRR